MILDHFARRSTDAPDRKALYALSEGRAVTFGELRAEAGAVSEILSRAALEKGARVLLVTGNRTAFFSTFLACLERRLVMIPLDGDSTASEIRATAERYEVSAVVTAAELSGVPESTALPGGVILHLLSRRAATSQVAGLEDACLLKLTSGSTGASKAVVVSESQLVNDGRHIAFAMGIGPDDVNLGIIPVSHSYGLGNLVMPLLLQGTAVALRATFTPGLLLEDLRTTEATVLPGVPFMFRHFQEREFRGALPSSLRLLLTAGARIDALTVAYFKERLGLKIHSFYGTSETGGICYDSSEEVTDPVTLGRPMPETTVRLNSAGRVHVRGNAVARGYLDSTEGEAGSDFSGGGFLTSDLGRFDGGGNLYLTGRASPLVNVAGRKVDALEVEKVLLEMAEIADARVLGVPCETRGQKLLACVVPRTAGLNPLAIRQYCARKLSAYKIPHEFILLEALPVDGRGKLDRPALEALIARPPPQ